MRCEIVRDQGALAALEPAWRSLWEASGTRAATLHPAWVLGFFESFGGAPSEGGELLTVAVREGAELVGVAPFYLSPPRGGALRVRELRLLGDGLAGVAHAILARADRAPAVLDVVVEALAAESSWDLLDLTFATALPDARSLEAEALAARFVALGRDVEREPSRGRPSIEVGALEPVAAMASSESGGGDGDGRDRSRLVDCLSSEVASALSQLDALRPRTRPRADAGGDDGARGGDGALLPFLARVLPTLVEAGAAAVRLVRAPSSRLGSAPPIAGEVVLRDGDRHVELLRVAADPASAAALLTAAVRRAAEDGARRLELCEPSPLASSLAAGERLRVFQRSAAAVLHRGYTSLVRRATTLTEAARAPLDSLARLADADLAEAATDAVGRVVARMATFSRLHLYRGELYVRSAAPPAAEAAPDLRLFGRDRYDALSEIERARLRERLALDEARLERDLARGDLAVLALVGGQPAGIAWCARGPTPVHVPEIGRLVRPLSGECLIHDVFVAPDVRGKNVAPAMLEFLARDLRGRDVYRGWALIERSNVASSRAFEKAGFVAVADVLYARMVRAEKLLVRPPDPDARAFLGQRPA